MNSVISCDEVIWKKIKNWNKLHNFKIEKGNWAIWAKFVETFNCKQQVHAFY